MTDQPEIPGAEDALKPVDPPFDNSVPKTEKPAPKKRAAKKVAAPEPEAPAPTGRDASYLPTLPEGYSYDSIIIGGPDGTITVYAKTDGTGAVRLEAGDINRSTPYPSFAAALRGAADRAKLLVKRAARKAELEALDAEFGE